VPVLRIAAGKRNSQHQVPRSDEFGCQPNWKTLWRCARHVGGGLRCIIAVKSNQPYGRMGGIFEGRAVAQRVCQQNKNHPVVKGRRGGSTVVRGQHRGSAPSQKSDEREGRARSSAGRSVRSSRYHIKASGLVSGLARAPRSCSTRHADRQIDGSRGHLIANHVSQIS